MHLLQLDTTIPLWGLLGALVSVILLAGGQALKLYIAEKANTKLFKDIFKELEHVRLRHQIELKVVKEANEKEIASLKDVLKENSKELRELRDMIMKMTTAVELIALKNIRTKNDN